MQWYTAARAPRFAQPLVKAPYATQRSPHQDTPFVPLLHRGTSAEDPSEPPRGVPRRPVLMRLWESALGLLVGMPQAPSHAYASTSTVTQSQYGNVVRLKDVEVPLLKAGLTAATQGNYELAEQLFTQYIQQVDPSEAASGYSNRGNVRMALKKTALAYEDYTEAIRLAPDAPIPWLNRALAAEADGRFADGIADCEQAIRLDPEESAAYYNKGNMEAETGQYEAALRSYTRSADLSPGIPGYRARQALVLNELGQKDAAVRLLKALVRKNPQFLEVRLALASVYWSMGQPGDAEAAYFDAVRYDPRIESWGEDQVIQFGRSREWTRRFPLLLGALKAFKANKPI